MIKIFLPLLFLPTSLMASVRTGTYTAATESEISSSFDLKSEGRALVTPLIEERTDSEEGFSRSYPYKTLKGTWRRTAEGIELSYGTITDRFLLESPCTEWPENYCLRFKETLKGGKTRLKFSDKPFVNWEWKFRADKISL